MGKGTLTSFTAEFTIYSLEGEVIARGTKELLAEVALGGKLPRTDLRPFRVGVDQKVTGVRKNGRPA